MLVPALATVIYLLSWCSSYYALPTPGTYSRDSFFGLDLEQTTRRSGQTTTIDYDLADFDEFGNDPGMYDVAGSPDAINLVDDNDQGFENQPGFDTGQSLFESMYSISPGVSKSPINSGGISDEINGNTEIQGEGGPSDEGVYTNTNQENAATDNQMVNKVEYNKQYTDTDIDTDVSRYKQQDNRGKGESSVNKIPSTKVTQAEEKSSTSQREQPVLPDSNENDKSDVNDKDPAVSRSQGKETKDRTVESGTETKANSVLNEDSLIKKGNGSPSQENVRPDTKFADTSGFSKGTSVSSIETGISRESSDEFGSYSVQDSNSQEFSASSGSNSNEHGDTFRTDSKSVSSVEIVSEEDVRNDKSNKSTKDVAYKSNNLDSTAIGKTYGASSESGQSDSIGSQEKDAPQTKYSSDRNRQYPSFEENVSQTSSSEDGLQPSVEENGSQSSSDENNSYSSSDENGSLKTSDETGSVSSSDENISDSTSDEAGSFNSDDSGSHSTSDENISKNSEGGDSKPSSSSTDYENDIDNDNDYDNDNDNYTGSDVNTLIQSSAESKFSNEGDKADSAQKDTLHISDSTEGKDLEESSPDPENDLAGCFLSSEKDGKYCYLLRSLYTICNGQFKQECMSNSGENKQGMSDKPPSNSKSSIQGSLYDTSSESVEEAFPDSTDSTSSGGSYFSSRSKQNSMSFETVENLSASFEKSRGILEVIDLIRDACQSICSLAESHTRNRPGAGNSGSDVDIDSSESSDEYDWIELSNEAFTDSDEDQRGSLDFSHGTASAGLPSNAILKQDEDVSGVSSGEYSVERNSNERSIDVSIASKGSAESTSSADSSGDRSFEYSSRPSENTSD